MKTFPNTIPVFPLSGVIYFPKTNLPLNIFEQRYIDLVNDTYKKDKLMGMVQSQKKVMEFIKLDVWVKSMICKRVRTVEF